MIRKIKKELQSIEDVKQIIKAKIEGKAGGKLKCANNKGHFQYYVDRKYLKKDKIDIATEIAEKEYCLKILKEIVVYEKALNTVYEYIETGRLQDVYRNLTPGRKALVKPLIRPIEDIVMEFDKIEYTGKGFEEENTTSYYTMKGERVRSKSEKIIADELYRNDVPYKYEMPIELHGCNKTMQIYPDFTCLNRRTGKKWILEHFGMMDNVGYCEKAMLKLDTYEKNNILLGRNLIVLHESSASPLNIKVLQNYIEEYL